MSYTDCVLCPNCKHWIDIDVEIEYAGINDMSAIITPIERSKPMLSITKVVERTISVQSTDGETEYLEVIARGECITKVNVSQQGLCLINPTAIDVMNFAIDHKTEFDELIVEMENVK